MREIWIRAKDLRPGDRFDYWGRILVAEEIHCSDEGVNVRVFLVGWTGGWKNPESPVLLLHRPWPPTSSESEQLDRILILVRTTESIARMGKKELDSHLEHLGTALETYELGKPQAEDSHRNPSLVDRHMTP